MSLKKGLIFLAISFGLALTFYLTGSLFRDTAPPVPPSLEPVQAALLKPGDFQDPAGCGACHTEIYRAWSGSKHADSWAGELFQPDFQQALAETDGAVGAFCGECHAPIAFRVGQLPPFDGSSFDAVSKRGISCDFCHTVSEVTETFNTGNISAPGLVKRGPRGDTVSPAHKTMYSQLHTDAKFCGACHNVRHPESEVLIIDTFDDWLAGPYAAEGITCQNCHMTPGPGVGKNPGRSSIIGNAKEREHIATHYFVGGSSWQFSRRGFEEHALKAEENLRAAARLDLEGRQTADGLELTVNVTNVGAGHKIPTGVTYIREMWLEVVVLNEQGETVFRSGYTDLQNNVDPNAVFFRKLFRDKEGNLTNKSWLAQEIGFDRRIPPRGTETETYRILAHGQRFTATVRLLYRSTSQAAVSAHLPNQGLLVPSVEMAKAEINF